MKQNKVKWNKIKGKSRVNKEQIKKLFDINYKSNKTRYKSVKDIRYKKSCLNAY